MSPANTCKSSSKSNKLYNYFRNNWRKYRLRKRRDSDCSKLRNSRGKLERKKRKKNKKGRREPPRNYKIISSKSWKKEMSLRVRGPRKRRREKGLTTGDGPIMIMPT
jgi:hypothetical protein